MRQRLLQTGILSLSLVLAATAFAQEGGQDEVTLKNGGVVRGTVVASEPGTSVKIIEMGQKQVRVIPWSQVSDVERGKYAPRQPAQPGPAGPGYGAPPPPPGDGPEPRAGGPGVVRLHIESPLPAQLIEHGGTAVGAYGGYNVVIHQLRPVCLSPCDRVVDGSIGQDFTVTGEFPAARPFKLHQMSGDVTMSVKPGSAGGIWGGATMITFGVIGGLTGLIMLPMSLASDRFRSPAFIGASTGLLLGGAGLLVGGIIIAGRSTTKVTFTPSATGRPMARAPRYWMGEF